jgi:6-pyruvoyltetrahydropterin/6-carboxytetrahydropterin synthase
LRGEVRASVTVLAEWCMGHRLPNHNGQCRHLHGHQYRAEATVEGQISDLEGSSDEGMVLDFTIVKDALKEVAKGLDHRFLIATSDPLVPVLRELPGVLVVPYVPTAENIGKYILSQLPGGVVRIRIWETPTSFADVWE